MQKSAPPQNVVKLSDLQLSLASKAGMVDILRGIDVSIDKGESVGIVGASGSGKTTLLMIIAGLEQATSGTVQVVEQPFHTMNEDELARARGEKIGIVFQSFHLVPTMTALENVALPLEFSGITDARARAEKFLTQVGLAHRLDHLPSQMSGGEQQRVAIARALAPEPAIILADEPTGNLDAETSVQIMDTLFEMRELHGLTLILVTHDPKLAERCERMITMADGKIDADTKVDAPTHNEAV